MQHTVTYNHQSQFIEMTSKCQSSVKLSSIATYSIGLTYAPEDVNSDGIIVLRSGNIQDGSITLEDIVRVNKPIKDSLYVKKGNILMCSRNGSASLVGKTAIVGDYPERMTFGAFMTLIKTDIPEYLNAFFSTPSFRYQVSIGKSSTMNQITQKMLDSIELPLVSVSEQEQFAEIVRQADKSKFDGFKSQFIEMFGCGQCAYLPLREVCIRYGEYGSNTPSIPFKEGNPRYIRITDLNYDGTLNNDKVCAKEFDNKYLLSKGDFLFARTGATVGKTYCHRDGDALYAGYLIRYVTNPDKLLPEFLSIYAKTQSFWSWIHGQMKMGAQPNISSKQYNELPVPVPSIEEQTSFLSIVRQSDKSKFELKKAIEAIDQVIKSLING